MSDDQIWEGVEPSRIHKVRKKRKPAHRVLRVLACIAAALAVMAVSVTAAYVVLTRTGRAELLERGGGQAPDLAQAQISDSENDAEGEGTQPLDPDCVRYNGEIYRYKSDIITILCLGVDRQDHMEASDISGEGGQADTIFLAVLDSIDKKLTLISVSRDTMTDIEVRDVYGNYIQSSTAQLAMAYAYGDGREESCQLVADAVSNLFYGLPIHGYCAINIEAIDLLNDLVGGVEVTIRDDFSQVDPTMVQGTTMVLKGKQATNYVRSRSAVGDGSNEARMERQKEYLQGFIRQARLKMREDLTLPLDVYNALSDYMVTNMSVNEAAYLATVALECSFTSDSIRNVSGTTTEGDLYAEYYVDEEALYELILDVFYEKETETQNS